MLRIWSPVAGVGSGAPFCAALRDLPRVFPSESGAEPLLATFFGLPGRRFAVAPVAEVFEAVLETLEEDARLAALLFALDLVAFALALEVWVEVFVLVGIMRSLDLREDCRFATFFAARFAFEVTARLRATVDADLFVALLVLLFATAFFFDAARFAFGFSDFFDDSDLFARVGFALAARFAPFTAVVLFEEDAFVDLPRLAGAFLAIDMMIRQGLTSVGHWRTMSSAEYQAAVSPRQGRRLCFFRRISSPSS